jgi:hypothetical protein
MTPEELNRAIEFIVQSQARLAAAQEQDRTDRLNSEKERIEAEKELKAFDQRLAKLFEMQVELLKTQTERLSRFEEESLAAQRRYDEFMRETRAWQQTFQIEAQKKHEESMGRLDRILERLTARPN